MDFEQYLERDIIQFLDSKMIHKGGLVIDREEEYGLYMTKDYLKELNFALENDELTKAKKLFDELKGAYAHLPKSSFERKKIYAILEKMYGKIQNYVQIREGRIEVIKSGDTEIQIDKNDKFSTKGVLKKEPVEISVEITNKYEQIDMHKLPIQARTEAVIKADDDKEKARLKNKDKKNDVSVESNILKKNSKDASDKDDASSSSQTQYPITINTQASAMMPEDFSTDGFGDLEQEIVKRTIELERLKTYVIERILTKLQEKLEEDNDKQNQKIEEMRRSIVEELSAELERRLGSLEDMQRMQAAQEPSEVITESDMKNLKKDIIKKVYEEAPHIISTSDNEIMKSDDISEEIPEREDYGKKGSEEDAEEEPDGYDDHPKIHVIDRKKDIIWVRRDENNRISGISEGSKNEKRLKEYIPGSMIRASGKKKHSMKSSILSNNYENIADANWHEFTGNDIDQTYQMKYMDLPEIDNTEHDSDKMTGNIGSSVHDNSKDGNIIDITGINLPQMPSQVPSLSEPSPLSPSSSDDEPDEDMNAEEKISEQPEHNISLKPTTRHERNEKINPEELSDEKVQEMYEEAIYTMFQNDYLGAANILQKVVDARPKHKAARIRLHECREAAGNA